MKIFSWNVNGVRSVIRQGFWDWFEKTDADIVCLQELKIDNDSFSDIHIPRQYNIVRSHAEKKGYSGVAIIYKKDLSHNNQTSKLGIDRFDNEGRYIELHFPDFALINVYMPHGGRQKENLVYKLLTYDKLIGRLGELKNAVVIGDFNIAHNELDLARPKSNKKNIMFTEDERAQINRIIALGYADTFRHFHPEGGHYTWWPWMANCRERNLGWRIDYAFISKNLLPKLKGGFISGDVRGSDHCPIGIELRQRV